MFNNQVEGGIIEQACKWDNHTIVTWDYEGANVIYFLGQGKGQYDVDIFLLFEHLLYKDIPLTLYVKTKNVTDMESVFITWDHNGTSVKYLPCVFKRVYVLDVSNFPKETS